MIDAVISFEFIDPEIADITSKIIGIRVPITGITRTTSPPFRARNIKYAPPVQRSVDKDAATKEFREGNFANGINRSAVKLKSDI